MTTASATLTALISLLIALRVATERAVEIPKGLVPWLAASHAGPRTERHRHAALQALAVVYGVLTAWLSGATLPAGVFTAHPLAQSLVLGLLASGGSGFWNSVLTYALQAKNAQAATPAPPTPPTTPAVPPTGDPSDTNAAHAPANAIEYENPRSVSQNGCSGA